jgi:thiosulfate/3-mercaptopyruvate sulfurtransferase
MLPIISPHNLIALKPGLFVLIDARAGAKDKYAAGHLEGALYADLERDLSDIKPDAAQGGRHPLPSLRQFSEVLGQLGIVPESHVVIYDDKNGSNAAARLWWMLRSVGHRSVQVLDGGYDAAVRAGFPTRSGVETATAAGPYPALSWALQQADIEEVAAASNNPDYLIIDVRDGARYRGETEPIDLIAGHIPQAMNVPLTGNLDADGFFLPPAVLREKYELVSAGRTPDRVIVHCGSGVTACHTLLAMDYAGLEIPKLYVGSWSEWSRNDRPMVLK